MKYTITYKRSAYEELLQLPANIAHKIKNAIDSLSENPRPLQQFLKQLFLSILNIY